MFKANISSHIKKLCWWHGEKLVSKIDIFCSWELSKAYVIQLMSYNWMITLPQQHTSFLYLKCIAYDLEFTKKLQNMVSWTMKYTINKSQLTCIPI